MAITEADLKFLSSERMTDTIDGALDAGGYAAAPILQDGVEGNVFPDVASADLVAGRRRIRLVYPAVLSNENSLAQSGGVAVYQRAADANVALYAYRPSGVTVRSAFTASEAVRNAVLGERVPDSRGVQAALTTAGSNVFGTFQAVTGGAALEVEDLVQVGDKVMIDPGLLYGGVVAPWRTVTAIDVGAGEFTIGGSALPGITSSVHRIYFYARAPLLVVSAPALVTDGVTAGSSTLEVDRLEVQLDLPLIGVPVPGTGGITPSGSLSGTGASADAWRSVKGLAGIHPAFGEGLTVLVDDPSNAAEPELRVVSRVNYHTGEITFTEPLDNAYTAGSIVSTIVPCGDWQARVTLPPFSQQAWTRTWSDTALGATISARYSGVIAMNNAGGIDDRWAIVFTSSSTFNLLSERFGQLASGNTGSNFSPLNPLTSQPFFTLPASGWGAGWIVGNTLRFNTGGAHSGVWYAQVISPGAAGADEGELIMRCDA
jgi:hypothetical protein